MASHCAFSGTNDDGVPEEQADSKENALRSIFLTCSIPCLQVSLFGEF